MLTVIILAIMVIVFSICFIRFFSYGGPSIGEFIGGTVLGIVVSFMCIVAISFFVTVVSSKEYVKTETIPIYALQNKTGVQGNFFLGCGSVNSEMQYYYIIKDELGYKIESIDMDETYLNEKDGKPYIEIHKQDFKSKFMRDNFVCLGWTRYVINIPPDSIKYDFNVDLGN